jgi:hypothetical protein
MDIMTSIFIAACLVNIYLLMDNQKKINDIEKIRGEMNGSFRK